MSARAMFIHYLTEYRKLAGLTQDQAAAKLQVSTSLYKKIEQAKARPQRDFAERCDKLFDTKVGVFVRAHEELIAEPFPDWFGPRVVHEDKADIIHEWEMRGIPGLLQTEAYARTVISAGMPYDPPDVIERGVQSRLERQDILSRKQPPKLWVVIAEGALRQVVGGAAVMREQLSHLISVSESANAVVQVLPFAATDAPGTDGPVTMFEFEEGPPVAYLEGWGGGRVVEDPRTVAGIATALTMIKGCSLSPTDSRQLMTTI